MSVNTLTRCAVPVVVALVGSGAPVSAESGTLVPLRSILRSCDFSPIPDRASQDDATATAVIHSNGGSVTADIRFAEAGSPNTHFDVALIQAPRSAGAPCDGPGPGVAVGSLNTDGGGVANTTISDGL